MSGDGSIELAGGPSAEELSQYDLNDFGNAMRLIRLAGGRIGADGDVDLSTARLLYLREAGWIGFNGHHWDLKGGERLAQRLAHKVAAGLWAQAEILADLRMKAAAAGGGEKPSKKEIGQIYDFAEMCGNAGRTSAMLRQAQAYLEVDLDAFDRHPLWLNVRNGTLKWTRKKGGGFDLAFQDRHDPADRLTRMAEVDYAPAAVCPLFDRLYASWLPEKPVADYMHTMLGYGATGATEEQAFFIVQGLGRDGKSTLMNIIRKILGSYAAVADVKTFLDTGQRSGSDASPDIARLAGDTRLITTSEPPKNARLNDAMLKVFTGGEPMTTRRLKQDIFEFTPVGKVFMQCNNRPQPGDDEGIWRRLKPVLFENQVPKDQVDKTLPEQLEAEREGILNWLAAGVGRWLTHGLVDPPRVQQAIEDYRKGSNPFSEWFADRLVIDKSAKVSASELFKAYKDWMEEMGHERPMSQTTFGKALADRQIILAGKDRTGRKMRSGARLKTPGEIAADNARADDGEFGSGGPPAPGEGGAASMDGDDDFGPPGDGQ